MRSEFAVAARCKAAFQAKRAVSLHRQRAKAVPRRTECARPPALPSALPIPFGVPGSSPCRAAPPHATLRLPIEHAGQCALAGSRADLVFPDGRRARESLVSAHDRGMPRQRPLAASTDTCAKQTRVRLWVALPRPVSGQAVPEWGTAWPNRKETDCNAVIHEVSATSLRCAQGASSAYCTKLMRTQGLGALHATAHACVLGAGAHDVIINVRLQNRGGEALARTAVTAQSGDMRTIVLFAGWSTEYVHVTPMNLLTSLCSCNPFRHG